MSQMGIAKQLKPFSVFDRHKTPVYFEQNCSKQDGTFLVTLFVAMTQYVRRGTIID